MERTTLFTWTLLFCFFIRRRFCLKSKKVKELRVHGEQLAKQPRQQVQEGITERNTPRCRLGHLASRSASEHVIWVITN